MTRKIGQLGIGTISSAIARGLADAYIIDGDRKVWPDQIDLNDFAETLSFGIREQTIMIDTGLDVFRIDIRHVQRRTSDEAGEAQASLKEAG